VVPGASGRFTEPGAMRQVVQATRTWFSRYLRPIAAGRVTGGYPPATALS
jgi:hypothetical protein